MFIWCLSKFRALPGDAEKVTEEYGSKEETSCQMGITLHRKNMLFR